MFSYSWYYPDCSSCFLSQLITLFEGFFSANYFGGVDTINYYLEFKSIAPRTFYLSCETNGWLNASYAESLKRQSGSKNYVIRSCASEDRLKNNGCFKKDYSSMFESISFSLWKKGQKRIKKENKKIRKNRIEKVSFF